MTSREARKIHFGFFKKPVITKDDEFMFEEASAFLLSNGDRDSRVIAYNLAAYYFEHGEYELALKYFTIAEAEGDSLGLSAYYIGMIHYYGLVGSPDYEKAFQCFSKGEGMNSLSRVMLAVMYRDGRGVKRDLIQYSSMMESMYDEAMAGYGQTVARPYIFFHTAEIMKMAKAVPQAVAMYKKAWEEWENAAFMRLAADALPLMGAIVRGLYSVSKRDEEHPCLFDLYDILTRPSQVEFVYREQPYQIISHDEGTFVSVEFNGRWFTSVDQFLTKAYLDDRWLVSLRNDIRITKVEEKAS